MQHLILGINQTYIFNVYFYKKRVVFLKSMIDIITWNLTANKILRFDPLEAVKHSKGDRMDYIAQFHSFSIIPCIECNRVLVCVSACVRAYIPSSFQAPSI